jgi:hypothetical protein
MRPLALYVDGEGLRFGILPIPWGRYNTEERKRTLTRTLACTMHAFIDSVKGHEWAHITRIPQRRVVLG